MNCPRRQAFSHFYSISLRKSYRFWLSLLVCFFLYCPILHGQITDPSGDTGIHPYETYDGAHENVNLGSGNVFVSVPLLKLPGRNGLDYSASLIFNSHSWVFPNWWNPNLGMVVTHIGNIYFHSSGTVNPNTGIQCLGGYELTDEEGGVHTFSNMQTDCIYVGGGQLQGMREPQYDVLGGGADRGEGISADLTTCKLTMKNGDSYPLLSGVGSGGCPLVGVIGGSSSHPPVLEDSNGNQIHASAVYFSPSGVYGGGDIFPIGTDIDTVGRSIIYSRTNHTIQYEDSSGQLRTITFNVQNFTVSCTLAFPGRGGIQPSGTASVITSVVLPDGLSYIFQYDGCGNLSKIVYPSGGYTRYVFDYSNYTHGGPLTDIELTQKYVCRAPSVLPGATSTGMGNTCPVSEDETVYAPSVDSTMCNHSANQVTDPLGNVTTYQFTNYQNCSYTVGEISRKIYQGSSSLLRTIQTSYVGDALTAIYPSDQTTILSNGLQSKIHWDYSGPANIGWVGDKLEYGWGQGAPGALVRETDTPFGCNFKKASETIKDGSGYQIANTTYDFDTLTLTSSGATQHDPNYGSSFTAGRCNVTAIHRWRNTDGAILTTTNQYDDAGDVISTTDPLSHTTTMSFADSWGNSACAPTGGNAAAYPTQVTDPMGHITTHSYNSCTGTVSSTKDLNNHITNFSYDLMDRLSQTNFPDDGAQISTCFSEVPGGSCYSSSYPLTVLTSQKITSSLNKTSSKILDGLARVTQIQSSDAACTDKVDITYDANERKSTVSNPYCSVGEATYGTTQYNYDALDRVTQEIPPDGTATSNNVSTAYDQLPISGSPLNNCAIVTDEAGNPRRSCSDALGRLIEVDEPSSNGTPSTPATGSFTITGSEQSVTTGSPTAGTGSVTLAGSEQSWQTQTVAATGSTGSATISGTLQSKQVLVSSATSGHGTISITGGPDQSITFDPCSQSGHGSCPQTPWNSGTITVTINGYQASAGYGATSTVSSIASALASSLNGSSSVSATASGANVNITARLTGSSTNYTYTTTTTYNTGTEPDGQAFFSGPSFLPSPSSGALTGGANATYNTVYDSGTTTITINGQAVSYGWSGSGTTASSIASNLASRITSNSSYATASSSGSTVSLASRTTGASVNYSLSSGSTYDSGNFSGPSFGISNSGGFMTGGTDAQFTTNYDSGTTTVTANGHSTPYNWSGSSTTSSSIATGVAQAINQDGSASVNATASGATVNLTARTAGSSTNYSLSAGTSSSHNSFTSSASGGSLIGGADAPVVHDSGTIFVTINGTQTSVSYGSGSTASSLASSLASAIPASLVTTSVSGATGNLTTVQVGAGVNYALSGGSSTSQPGTFASPSFAVSLSGFSLTGGADGSPYGGSLSMSVPAVTLYSYNLLDDLTGVTQEGPLSTPASQWRTRTFTYNSLSQLLTASNPESGLLTYSYDADGNVISRLDARGITTNYSYDALNRLVHKSYVNDPTNTVAVSYGYDGLPGTWNCSPTLSPSNPIGQRTSMCDAAGSESWSYPITPGVGWETTDKRITNGVSKTITTQDNLDSSLASIAYPDTGTVAYSYNVAGRPVGAMVPQAGVNLVSNATYQAFGGFSGALFGTGITVTGTYNKRLQPVSLMASGGSGAIYNLGYDFHLGSGDNGNVYQVANGKDDNRTQNFTYDALNRIATAYSNGPNWGESYAIDPWGNLINRAAVTGKTMYEPLNTGSATTRNQLSGFTYDAAGNMTQNGGTNYVYDAENRLLSANGVTYTYDGDGNRVMKSSGPIYWGAGPLEETDLNGNMQHEYIFFNGKRVVRGDADFSVHYYFSDHLNSTSVMTDASGNIQEDLDYYPYGGIASGTYADPFLFNGKERDTETGFYNFGARYDTANLGRWMTPDWAAKPTAVPYANFGNPQSLNLYAYVENNPTTLGDPDGHETGMCYACGPVGNDITVMDPNFKDPPITKAEIEVWAGVGLTVGTMGISEAAGGLTLLRNLLGLAAATAPTWQPILVDTIEGMSPGPPGTLTIARNTRLTEQEISAGLAYSRQTGTALIQSSHIGEEFVDAAGTTYDVMQAGPAAKWTAKNFRNWQKSFADHLLKADVTLIDLRGASKGQVSDIEQFLSQFKSECAERRIQYVRGGG